VHATIEDDITASINGGDIVDGVATLYCKGATLLELLDQVFNGGWRGPVGVEVGKVHLHLFSGDGNEGGSEMVEYGNGSE
jgi:hypothetical protein